MLNFLVFCGILFLTRLTYKFFLFLLRKSGVLTVLKGVHNAILL